MRVFLTQLKSDIIRRFQLATRGYARIDSFNLNYWFLETVPKMILELRNDTGAIPCGRKFEEVENFPKDWLEEKTQEIRKLNGKQTRKEFENWQLILTRMAWCLSESGKDIENEYWEEYFKLTYEFGKENSKLKKKWQERDLEIAKYQDDCYKEGMALFVKYFPNLWW